MDKEYSLENQNLENNTSENLVEKQPETEKDGGEDRVLSALDKEIARRKKELYEIGEELRKTKEANVSLIEKIRNENLDIALKELEKKYSLSEDEKKKIVDEISSKYQDVVSKEKIIDIASGVYYLLHPEKIREMEEKVNKVSSDISSFQKREISSSSTYQPQTEESLTPEEMEIVRKYNVKPETIKKLRKGEDESFLTKNAKTLNY
jgi:hypothetical protein